MRPIPTARGLAPLLAGCLLAAAPVAAHAQFGKLVKRAAQAAAETAVEATARGAMDGATGAGSGARGVADGATPNRLEITAERLDAFAVAMRGPLENARRRAATRAAEGDYEAAREAYEAKHDAYTTCKKRLTDNVMPDMSSPTLQRAVERFTTANVELTPRIVAAQTAGDDRLARQLSDSVQTLMVAVDEASYPALRPRCGAPPREPLARRGGSGGDDKAADRPEVPAGMTPMQFGVLRERVGAWLVAGGVGGALTPTEVRALESRRALLEPMAPFFRDYAVEWRDVLAGMR
jgi:hypothetical protein